MVDEICADVLRSVFGAWLNWNSDTSASILPTQRAHDSTVIVFHQRPSLCKTRLSFIITVAALRTEARLKIAEIGKAASQKSSLSGWKSRGSTDFHPAGARKLLQPVPKGHTVNITDSNYERHLVRVHRLQRLSSLQSRH